MPPPAVKAIAVAPCASTSGQEGVCPSNHDVSVLFGLDLTRTGSTVSPLPTDPRALTSRGERADSAVAIFAAVLAEEVLQEVGHRMVTLTVPRRWRPGPVEAGQKTCEAGGDILDVHNRVSSTNL